MWNALERHHSHTTEGRNNSTEASPVDDAPSGVPGVAQATRVVPGETYIGSGETAGLPQIDFREQSQYQASQVVEAHRPGFLRRLRHRPHVKHSPKQNHRFSPTTTSDHDVERSAEAHRAAPRKQVHQRHPFDFAGSLQRQHCHTRHTHERKLVGGPPAISKQL